MINLNEVFETNKMIHEMNLDVRTITIGISLLDCVGTTLEEVKENIYRKITTVAADLVKTGKDIEREFGIPIVNKRISVTPVSLVEAVYAKHQKILWKLPRHWTSSQEGWSQFPWRIFCPGKQGYDKSR